VLDFYGQHIPAIGFTVLTGALILAFLAYAIVFMVKKKYPRGAWDIVFGILNWLLIAATGLLLVALFLPVQLAFVLSLGIFAVAQGAIMGYALVGGTLFALVLCAIMHIAKTRKITPAEKALIKEKKAAKRTVKNAVDKGQYTPVVDESSDTDDSIENIKAPIVMGQSVDSIGKAGDEFNKQFMQDAIGDEQEAIEYGTKTLQRIEEVESMMRDLERAGECEQQEADSIQEIIKSLPKDDEVGEHVDSIGEIDDMPDTYDSLRAKVFDEVREFARTIEMVEEPTEELEPTEEVRSQRPEVRSDDAASAESEILATNDEFADNKGQYATKNDKVTFDPTANTAMFVGYDDVGAKAQEQVKIKQSILSAAAGYMPTQRRIILSKRYGENAAQSRYEYEERRAQRAKEALDNKSSYISKKDVSDNMTSENVVLVETAFMQASKTGEVHRAPLKDKKVGTSSKNNPQSRQVSTKGTMPPVRVISHKKTDVKDGIPLATVPPKKPVVDEVAQEQIEIKTPSPKTPPKKSKSKKSTSTLFSEKKTSSSNKKSSTKKSSISADKKSPTPAKGSSIGAIPIVQDVDFEGQSHKTSKAYQSIESTRKYVLVKRGSAGHLFDDYLDKKDQSQKEKLQGAMSSIIINSEE